MYCRSGGGARLCYERFVTGMSTSVGSLSGGRFVLDGLPDRSPRAAASSLNVEGSGIDARRGATEGDDRGCVDGGAGGIELGGAEKGTRGALDCGRTD